MIGKAHILVASGATHLLTTSGVPIPNAQPANVMDFGAYADELTWILGVDAVSGAPTAWSLGVKFQYCLPHTTSWQYENPRWFDLQAENVATNIVEGVGWYSGTHTKPVDGGFGTVADQTDTLPITVQRTVRAFGLRCRVVFDPQFTGGTNPGLKVNLVVVPKGA